MSQAIIASADWSAQQEQAIDLILSWHRNFDPRVQPYFYLAGFAGTGKTTLAHEIARLVGGIVIFAAFTGKAALVLRSKGCDGAQTLDKLLYKRPCADICLKRECEAPPPPCKQPCQHHRLRYFPKTFNPRGPIASSSLVIVDECSMLNETLVRDLLRYGVPVLMIGDPGQLPPVNGDGCFADIEPDCFLMEIHRQAEGNPIIQMSVAARTDGFVRWGDYGSSAAIGLIDPRRFLDFDQIIVGTHRTRQVINAACRRMLGITDPLPVVGEKLLCLRTSYDKPLFNGGLWTVVCVNPPTSDGFINLTVEDDTKQRADVDVPIDLLLTDDAENSDVPGDPFVFGYAITTHKSQGSQWEQVLVVDESAVFKVHQKKHLYTAITRAADNIVVASGVHSS